MKDDRWEWFTRAAQLPADWDAALPKGHYLHSQTLQVHDDAGLADVEALYVRVTRKGRIIFIAAFQTLNINTKHADDSKWTVWQKALWRFTLQIRRPRLLVAGHLFRHDISALWCDTEVLSPYLSFRYYHEAIRQAKRKSCSAAVLVKDVPEHLVEYFHNYAPRYLMLRNDISMQMDIRKGWNTIDDYAASLKHKYGQRYRKLRQGWEGLKVRELSAEEVEENKAVIYGLYKEVTVHQPITMGLLNADFLVRLKNYYGTQLKVWLVEEDGIPVAFASAWVYGSRFDMFYIGFSYARNASLNLYFNLLYFSIEQAIILKKETLVLGRTALEAKARVGCKPIYLYTFLYIRNRWLRSLVSSQQQGSFSSEGEWENRHPFKIVP